MTDDATNEKALTPFDYRLRHAIYDALASTAHVPAASDLAEDLSSPLDTIVDSLQRLARAHSLVLAPSQAEIWMAHPFSAIPTLYPLETDRGVYFGNCAWDVLAIPSLVGIDGRCETRCPESAQRLGFTVSNGELSPVAGVIHFAVPARKFWENVAYT